MSISPLAQAVEWQNRGPFSPQRLATAEQAVFGSHWCHQGTAESKWWMLSCSFTQLVSPMWPLMAQAKRLRSTREKSIAASVSASAADR